MLILRSRIQIHLMLLFIEGNRAQRRRVKRFKYISCYCLSPPVSFKAWFSWYSNTSHVIVYHCERVIWRERNVIQIHLMLLFITRVKYVLDAVGNSNTSHVIVYPGWLREERELTLFKYISCYCLS